MVKKFYDNIVLKYPIIVLVALLLAISTLAYNATKLEIDASAETLLLDDDKDLKFSREVNKRYYNPNFLVVTYTPKENLLSKNSLDTLKNLSEDLLKIGKIESITSILNVPLIQSPLRPITDLVNGVDTLQTATFDMNLVRKEFLNSQLYSNNLVSADFKTTGMLLNLKNDEKYFKLLEKRNSLLTKKRTSNLNKEEKAQLENTILEFKKHRDFIREKDEKEIAQIRAIIKKYNSNASIFLGGVDMIANDIVGFVKSDLAIYGSTLIILLILILWVIFRHTRWVVLPIAICLLSVVSTAGILGLFNLEVTVISSNFISLQLIITLSIVLHLIVRYRELNVKYKNASQYKLVINTVLSKVVSSKFPALSSIFIHKVSL